MSDVKRFRFVSPGIFINEIDQSQVPAQPARMGPVIIGRATHGPGFRPTVCNSFADFVETFGRPVAGGKNDDLWRNGNTSAPTYAAYAAQAYLRNSNPVTFVRVLGSQHPNHSSTVLGREAGWRTENSHEGVDHEGGAYGLFVIESGSLGTGSSGTINVAQGTLEAIHSTMNASGGDVITITNAAGLKVDYVITNTGAAGSKAAGTALTSGEADNVNTGTTYTTTSGASKAVAITLNCTAGGSNQHAFLGALEAGIEHANGHNGTITITDVPGGADASGQGMTLLSTHGDRGTAMATATNDMTLTIGTFTGGVADSQAAATGTLAAVWYLNKGTIELSGALRGTEDGTAISHTGSSIMIGNTDSKEWKILIKDENGSIQKESSFNFNRKSEQYIRNVFNTNPTLVNSSVHSTTENYWLGETFEKAVAEKLTGTGTANSQWGFIAGIASGSSAYDDERKEAMPSETGWIISQDLSTTTSTYDPEDDSRVKKLFKFVSLDGGSEWNQNNLKISLKDIKPGKDQKSWPTFAVEIRAIGDHDKTPQIIERYSNCNLNKNSVNYVGRKIGNREVVFDTTLRRNIPLGDYRNNSNFVRVEVKEENCSREAIPFGAFGPPRYKTFQVVSGSAIDGTGQGATLNGFAPFLKAGSTSDAKQWTGAGNSIVNHAAGEIIVNASETLAEHAAATCIAPFTGTFEYPAVSLRVSASDGGVVDQRKAYFGADTSQGISGQSTDVRYETSVGDILKTKPHQTSAAALDFASQANAEYSWIFTLDDLRKDNDTGNFAYVSGSRKGGTSLSAVSGANFVLTASGGGINRFTTVLYGGFDGFDITEREPLNNTRALSNDRKETDSYALYSVQKAIDLVSDPDMVECNLMALPGIHNNECTNRLVDVAEERGDALAIIDLPHDFTPDTENTSTNNENRGNVDEAAAALKDREIDSSYGCCYYPWVQIADSFDSSLLWVPPSVVALGSMAYSEAVKEVWFAPAGFSRGGLTATSAGGVSVLSVNQQLSSKQRDTLYEVGINPIASFPAEGIVIFGQKTLLSVPSALDRINVRRLLIFLKKEVSRIAATTLFEQNVETTWNAFRAQVESLLSSVKNRLGLTEYKVVLDASTTTPELIDRNILYAKVFLKPARAIEFIALDFFITRSGASFED